ncbi:MAG: pilus assembly protein TadG-related protein [Pseudomonadota bacterium]
MFVELKRKLTRQTEDFRKDESGALLVFGLMVMTMMLVGGGMAVDFMRYERERARLQYALDRSILAAAALSQPLDPKVVVADYLQKSEVDYTDLQSDPQSGTNFRRVEASARISTNTFFVNMVGVNSLEALSGSAAEERVRKVELSLVLDVSGSMGWASATPDTTKLEALQEAAIDFAETVLTADNNNLVSLNIIPYNMQVNVGQDVMDELAVTLIHSDANCIDFTTTQFETMDMDTGILKTTYKQTGRFDPFYTSIRSPNTDLDDNSSRLWMCPTANWSQPILMSQNFEDIRDYINALEAGGNTSIDIGVKWGNFFLDDSSNSVLGTLPASYGVDALFSDRPAAHSDDDTLKMLIVMTDGENTTQYELEDEYYTGLSDIYYDPDSSILSVYDDRRDGWGYDDHYFRSEVYDYDSSEDDFFDTPQNPSEAIRMDWSNVWAWMGPKYHAYYHHYRMRGWAGEYWEWRNKTMDQIGKTTKDSRLLKACQAAKDEEIVVFTIGFEVDNTSAGIMEDCATSESNFYRVEGIEIANAFNGIVDTIQRLKLTR